ncbi:MAG: signal peptidase II [Shimia sp.]
MARSPFRPIAITAAILFVVDQLTKWLVVHVLGVAQQDLAVFPPYLQFRMAWNYGINFGLFSQPGADTRWILIGIALAIVAVVLWWMRHETNRWALLSAGLLVGGAFGNIVDRVLYGAVADFLNMSCCGIRNPYSFNVADISIFVGAIGLVIFATEDGQRA